MSYQPEPDFQNTNQALMEQNRNFEKSYRSEPEVLRLFTESLKGVSRKFKGCFKEVSAKFQGCFSKI